MKNRAIYAKILVVGCALSAGAAEVPRTAQEAWSQLVPPSESDKPEFAFVESDSALPNVLLYGDSISIGYTSEVRTLLEGKANVYRIHCNGGASGTFIRNMEKMETTMRDGRLDGHWDFPWDVIHFNVGLHDLKYLRDGKLDKENGTRVCAVEAYGKNLRSIIAYLEKTAPGVKLVFATTTPVPEGAEGRVAGDAIIYNKAGLQVVEDHPEIVVNDLYSLTKPCQSIWWVKPGDVHYAPAGQQAQADAVARSILEALQ